MARIKLVKAQTTLSTRNTSDYISKYLPYVNFAGLVLLALRVFNVL